MTKISIPGILLFVAMVLTAITVSSHQPEYARDQHVWISSSLPAGSTQTYDTSYRKVLVSGESGGVEDNPFVICIGVVALLALSLGFFRYHQILEARRKEDEADQTAQQRANQFGTRPIGKEPPR